jgi:hypothetical protein
MFARHVSDVRAQRRRHVSSLLVSLFFFYLKRITRMFLVCTLHLHLIHTSSASDTHSSACHSGQMSHTCCQYSLCAHSALAIAFSDQMAPSAYSQLNLCPHFALAVAFGQVRKVPALHTHTHTHTHAHTHTHTHARTHARTPCTYVQMVMHANRCLRISTAGTV